MSPTHSTPALGLGLGADFIATGHYARLVPDSDGCHLRAAQDRDKGQTYFLFMVGQRPLCRTLLPLGKLTKPRVRTLAAAAGSPNCEKKDSTGICFIGERRFRHFPAHYLPANPGDIEAEDGRVETMRHTGRAMNRRYKGTSLGGLAVNVLAC